MNDPHAAETRTNDLDVDHVQQAASRRDEDLIAQLTDHARREQSLDAAALEAVQHATAAGRQASVKSDSGSVTSAGLRRSSSLLRSSQLEAAQAELAFQQELQAAQRRLHVDNVAAERIPTPPSPVSLKARSDAGVESDLDAGAELEEPFSFSDEESSADASLIDPSSDEEEDTLEATPSAFAPVAGPSRSRSLGPAITLHSPSPHSRLQSPLFEFGSSQASSRDGCSTPPFNPYRRYRDAFGEPMGREAAPSPETPTRAMLIKRGDEVVGCVMGGGKRRRYE